MFSNLSEGRRALVSMWSISHHAGRFDTSRDDGSAGPPTVRPYRTSDRRRQLRKLLRHAFDAGCWHRIRPRACTSHPALRGRRDAALPCDLVETTMQGVALSFKRLSDTGPLHRHRLFRPRLWHRTRRGMPDGRSRRRRPSHGRSGTVPARPLRPRWMTPVRQTPELPSRGSRGVRPRRVSGTSRTCGPRGTSSLREADPA
jgi:hypothetical protein